jgi:hypothetical protein
MTALPKTKINTTFVSIDGMTGTRSKLDDFRSVRARIFARLQAIDDASANHLIIPGVNAYNQGDYEGALSYFMKSVAEVPAFEEELRPHINICKRVTHFVLSPRDIGYRDACSKWERLPFFIKWFKRAPLLKLRCKHCGHFTAYLDPNEGLAYLGGNNCENCGRGYPIPDFAWDGIDGQAYIYYRNSVTEKEFYKEFETQFDVEVDHRMFLAPSRA